MTTTPDAAETERRAANGAPGALYVVATPIGNLSDMTYRAVETLKAADFIIAEDTRVTRKLLTRYEINKNVFSCHKFNETARLDFFINEIMSGKTAALVSDAGTPCISDPGHLLVSQAIKNGVVVIPVGGTGAVTAALSVSGFDLKSFAFYGFPPKKISENKKFLTTVQNDSPETAVFFESPKRIINCLERISESFPDAEVCLCNDLTKKFEKIYWGGVTDVIEELLQNPDREKGEYTLVLRKNKPDRAAGDGEEKIPVEILLAEIRDKTGCTLKEAVNILSDEKKGALRKKDVYAAAVRLKNS